MTKKKLNFPNTERKKTDKWDGGEDPRGHKEAGKYPNQHVFKTRSGHSVIYDDTKDLESLTIQHRSGTAIQMLPGGGLQLTAHNGKYEIILGEEKVTINGVQDVTVKGDCSLRVYGDYRQTVHGNIEISATGSIVHRAKNMIQTSSENHSVISQNITQKASDASQYSANKHMSVVARNTVVTGTENMFAGGKNFALEGSEKLSAKSTNGDMQIYAKNDFNQQVESGDATFNFGQKVNQLIGSDFLSQISGSEHVTVAQNSNRAIGGDSSSLTSGVRKIQAAQIKMQEGATTPQTPSQGSFFDILAEKHISSSGQPNSPDRGFA